MAQAVAAGVMFTEPRTLDHDGWIQAARHSTSAVTAPEIGDAFLASLTSRRMDLRSALASYALTRHLPDHPYTEQHGGVSCAVCGISRPRDDTVEPEDMNRFSQIRFGYGGIPGNIQYAAFDLEQFARAPRLEPSSDDISLGQQIIDYLRHLPPTTTAAQAARGLTMVPGTRDQRDNLMESLGICGILHCPGHPSYADAFIPHSQAATDWPSQRFAFGCYPTWWWKAEGGTATAHYANSCPGSPDRPLITRLREDPIKATREVSGSNDSSIVPRIVPLPTPDDQLSGVSAGRWSPLTESNRRPSPYHGELTYLRRALRPSLMALYLRLCLRKSLGVAAGGWRMAAEHGCQPV